MSGEFISLGFQGWNEQGGWKCLQVVTFSFASTKFSFQLDRIVTKQKQFESMVLVLLKMGQKYWEFQF